MAEFWAPYMRFPNLTNFVLAPRAFQPSTHVMGFSYGGTGDANPMVNIPAFFRPQMGTGSPPAAAASAPGITNNPTGVPPGYAMRGALPPQPMFQPMPQPMSFESLIAAFVRDDGGVKA